jgi:hypothetical protein
VDSQLSKGNQFTKQDRRFLVEMTAELSAKIDKSTDEGKAFEGSILLMLEEMDAYFRSIRRE